MALYINLIQAPHSIAQKTNKILGKILPYEARADFYLIFCLFFGQNCFWDLQTFSVHNLTCCCKYVILFMYSAIIIQGTQLFKGGNYLRKYGILFSKYGPKFFSAVYIFGRSDNDMIYNVKKKFWAINQHTASIWFWMAIEVGVAYDGNFSSFLISRSWYNHFQLFSMGGNGGLH